MKKTNTLIADITKTLKADFKNDFKKMLQNRTNTLTNRENRLIQHVEALYKRRLCTLPLSLTLIDKLATVSPDKLLDKPLDFLCEGAFVRLPMTEPFVLASLLRDYLALGYELVDTSYLVTHKAEGINPIIQRHAISNLNHDALILVKPLNMQEEELFVIKQAIHESFLASLENYKASYHSLEQDFINKHLQDMLNS